MAKAKKAKTNWVAIIAILLCSMFLLPRALELVDLLTLNKGVEKKITTEYIKVQLVGDNKIELSQGEKTVLGKTKARELILQGADGARLTATGEGAGAIQASDGVTLVVKNLTIKDESGDTGGSWWNYLWFGGKLRFENCIFSDSIYVADDAAAEFIGCTFTSTAKGMYSAWVADGSATFKDYTFIGYRGLKIHEFEYDDVVTVRVEDCTFRDLSVKPGIAIGTFTQDPKHTTVEVVGCLFENCNAWDTEGSLVGIDGGYEADMCTDEFNFVWEDNEIRFTESAE